MVEDKMKFKIVDENGNVYETKDEAYLSVCDDGTVMFGLPYDPYSCAWCELTKIKGDNENGN